MRIVLLTMIRDESSIITRMLDSAKNFVDGIVVVDTGSVDNTLEIVRNYKVDVPVQIFETTWKNFGYNRTEALRFAQAAVDLFKFDPFTTQILFVDADQLVYVHLAVFNKHELTRPAYEVMINGTSQEYPLVRMTRADMSFNYVGRTHEYLVSDPMPLIQGLTLLHKGDGGYKKDKFMRDEKLLIEEIAEHPDQPRWVFYLAQTYKNVGNYIKAIDEYEKRANMAGGFEEEVWLSLYDAGRCCLELKETKNAINYMHRAFVRRPWRIEPVLSLVHQYSEVHNHRMAYTWAKIGTTLGTPKGERLFREFKNYDAEFSRYLAIHSFHVEDFETGLKACQVLNALPDNHWYKPFGLINELWYMACASGRHPKPSKKFDAANALFAVHTADEDIIQITKCLTSIHSVFPASKKVAILDGWDRPDVIKLAYSLGFEVLNGEKYSTVETWHKYWNRLLEWFRNTGLEYCFKVDLDVEFLKAPENVPIADYFGDTSSLQKAGTFVREGVCGISRKAALEISTSGGLSETGYHLLRPISSLLKTFSSQQMIQYTMYKIGSLAENWPEIKTVYKQITTS